MPAKGKKKTAVRKKANGYKMPPPIPLGEVIHDTIKKKKWEIGPSIGVGGFGEIYSACQLSPKKKSGDQHQYPFVIKVEPHENGPLFVEMHFYIRCSIEEKMKSFMQSRNLSQLGMPLFYGSGLHEYNGEQFRYLVLERYGKDLWSKFKEYKTFPVPVVFQIGLQMLDVLEYIHSLGYVHADLKGANIMMGLKPGTENQAYLLDFGLASRLNDKEFKADPKSAHNGTLEYTSRDAHLGVPTVRGDLEILAYNMLQWAAGALPWGAACERKAPPASVHQLKAAFMDDVRPQLAAHYPLVPEALIQFFEYINTLKPKETPNYDRCREIFETYLKKVNRTRASKIDFAPSENNSEPADAGKPKRAKRNGDAPKAKRGRKPKAKTADSDNENEIPDRADDSKAAATGTKRKSGEPATLARVKKMKPSPKATPPAKHNHANIATQTSAERARPNTRQVSFDSPICQTFGKASVDPADSSGDIFDDSFEIRDKKIKPKRRLLSKQEVTVKRVVRKKVTTTAKKGESWKDAPAVVNGRSPPK